MQNNPSYAYITAKNNEFMHKHTHKMHKNGGHVSALMARRSDNSDDVLWSRQEKVGFDHNIWWFGADFGAKKQQKNDVF